MSFLYDKNVYDSIINKAFSKIAQENGEYFSDLAKKLVSNLDKELSGTKDKVSAGIDSASNLDIANLQSLDKLLQFLSFNKIKINDKRIVYSGEEYSSLTDDLKSKLMIFKSKVSRDINTREWNKLDFYVDFDMMKEYISYLQDKASKLKNDPNSNGQGTILSVMLSKIVGSITDIKPDANLFVSDDKSKLDLPDSTIIDVFPSKKFDVRNPFQAGNVEKLLLKDLASKESLVGWLKQQPEAQIITGNAAVNFTDPQANHCDIISILYSKASNMRRNASTPQEIKISQLYLDRIVQFGPLFTDAGGRACRISSTRIESGQQSGSGKGSESNSASLNIEKAIQLLPLGVGEIDFNRIRSFFEFYKNIVSDNNANQALSAMKIAEDAMSTATSVTQTKNQTSFRLTRNIEDVFTWLTSPAGNYSLKFLNALKQVIIETGRVVSMFYNEYARTLYSGDRVTLTREQKSLVDAQIVGSSSIHDQNLRDINTLISNLKQAVGVK